MANPDRFTLEVNFEDIEKYNQYLSTAIIEEYYRFEYQKRLPTMN